MKLTRPTNHLMKEIPEFDRISNYWFALYKKPITIPQAKEIQKLWNQVAEPEQPIKPTGLF
jgi:hypothetical protein